MTTKRYVFETESQQEWFKEYKKSLQLTAEQQKDKEEKKAKGVLDFNPAPDRRGISRFFRRNDNDNRYKQHSA